MNLKKFSVISFALLTLSGCQSNLQREHVEINDSNSPLHLMKPEYPVMYGETTLDSISSDIDRIYTYLDRVTPMALEERGSQTAVTDVNKIDTNTIFKKGDFRLIS